MLPLREAAVDAPDALLKDVMTASPIAVLETSDRADAAEIIQTHDFLSLPVIGCWIFRRIEAGRFGFLMSQFAPYPALDEITLLLSFCFAIERAATALGASLLLL